MLDHWICVSEGDYRLCLDAQMGGHVVEYSVNGRNALLTEGPEVGSTFWPSPQSAWGWPPPQTLDKSPYQAAVKNNTVILTSDICPQTGLQLRKQFELFGDRLLVTYTMLNARSQELTFAPWEISRIAGGITFFAGQQVPEANSSGEMTAGVGHMWHIYDVGKQLTHEKVFINGSSGWLANANQGLLLIKQFAPVPVSQVAPGEAEIEIYAHGDPLQPYIEMEQQGALRSIAVEGEATWCVTWALREIPWPLQNTQNQLPDFVEATLEQLGAASGP